MKKKKENEKLEKLTIRLSKEKKESIKKMVEKSSYNSIWIVNPFLDNFYKDTFLYSIGVK